MYLPTITYRPPRINLPPSRIRTASPSRHGELRDTVRAATSAKWTRTNCGYVDAVVTALDALSTIEPPPVSVLQDRSASPTSKFYLHSTCESNEHNSIQEHRGSHETGEFRVAGRLRHKRIPRLALVADLNLFGEEVIPPPSVSTTYTNQPRGDHALGHYHLTFGELSPRTAEPRPNTDKHPTEHHKF